MRHIIPRLVSFDKKFIDLLDGNLVSLNLLFELEFMYVNKEDIDLTKYTDDEELMTEFKSIKSKLGSNITWKKFNIEFMGSGLSRYTYRIRLIRIIARLFKMLIDESRDKEVDKDAVILLNNALRLYHLKGLDKTELRNKLTDLDTMIGEDIEYYISVLFNLDNWRLDKIGDYTNWLVDKFYK